MQGALKCIRLHNLRGAETSLGAHIHLHVVSALAATGRQHCPAARSSLLLLWATDTTAPFCSLPALGSVAADADAAALALPAMTQQTPPLQQYYTGVVGAGQQTSDM